VVSVISEDIENVYLTGGVFLEEWSGTAAFVTELVWKDEEHGLHRVAYLKMHVVIPVRARDTL
jgi:hypothetical protein